MLAQRVGRLPACLLGALSALGLAPNALDRVGLAHAAARSNSDSNIERVVLLRSL